jgi:hypothetical protein
MVYHLLRWDAPVLSGRICAGVIHSDELAAREFVPFALPSGPVLPVLFFLCWRCAALWERRSSTGAWLQGFSSCSPAAVSHQWSSTRMTTSLVVERSEQGCDLPPALSFKDVHHPRWVGRRAELGSCLPHGLVTRFFLQHLEEKDVHQPCGGGELRLRGAGRLQAP